MKDYRANINILIYILVYGNLVYCSYVYGMSTDIKIPIGAIFTPGNEEEIQTAFRFALFAHNQNESSAFTVEPVIEIVESDDPYLVTRQLCLQLSRGIFTLVSPIVGPSYETLVSYSNTFQMPFVHPGFSQTSHFRPASYGISMRPRYLPAIIDVIKYYGWSGIIYLYDSDDGLLKLQHLFALVNENHTLELRAVRRVSNSSDAHAFLREIEFASPQTHKYVILECDSATAKNIIINHVRDIYMGNRNFHFLLTSLVMDDYWNQEVLEFGAVNITGFRILKPSSLEFRQFINTWKNLDEYRWSGAGKFRLSRKFYVKEIQITKDLHNLGRMADAALMFDGAKVILDSYSRLLKRYPHIFRNNFRRGEIYNNGSKGIDCRRNPNAWEHGDKINRFMRKTDINGLTGKLAFDEYGFRENFSVDIVEMTINSEMAKIAQWSQNEGLEIVPAKYHRVVHESTRFDNKTYIVTSIIEDPYLMHRKEESGFKLEGNDRYEGYSRHLNITYKLKLVSDRKYGGEDPNGPGGWNGMVGELVRKEADMAIAPLTITSKRERVIDFTKPFMSLGISIMIKKPAKKIPGIFSFMNPLSKEIWMCVILSYTGVSVVLFLVSRFSPCEWRYEETVMGHHVSNDFSLYNSLWFSLGAIMQQGCDVCPRSFAGRIVGSCWWFFTLILLSSYTANLAAFLTVERMVTPINSADDLAKQTEVEYGLLKDSSTMEFFKKSKITVFSRMWEFMNSKKNVFVDNYPQGINRVRESKGKYAFLIESTQNDYVNEREPCDTMKVGRNLDAKGYGVGTPLGSALRYYNSKRRREKVHLNLAVLHLKENGDLTKLENKWWFDRSECKTKDYKDAGQNALNLGNVAGCFYILIGGLILAMIVALGEYILQSYREAKRTNISFFESMRNNMYVSITGGPKFGRVTRFTGDSITHDPIR